QMASTSGIGTAAQANSPCTYPSLSKPSAQLFTRRTYPRPPTSKLKARDSSPSESCIRSETLSNFSIRNFSTDVAVSSGFFISHCPRTSVCSAIRRPPCQSDQPSKCWIFVSRRPNGIERQHIISELKKDNPRSAPRVAPAISATLPLQRHLVLRSSAQPIDSPAASHSSHPASGGCRKINGSRPS